MKELLAGLLIGAGAGFGLWSLFREDDMESLNYIYCAKCSDKMVWVHGVNLRFMVQGEWETIRICKQCNAREQSNEPEITKEKQETIRQGEKWRDEKLRRLLDD